MCKTNTKTQICGFPVSDYISKSKPSVFFCPETRGAIVVALIQLAKQNPSSTSTFAQVLINNHFKSLAKHCNLDLGTNQKIIVAFKNTSKWVERCLSKFNALVKGPKGWTVADGMSFESDEKAGLWFMRKIDDTKADNLSLASLSVQYPKPLRMENLMRLGLNTNIESQSIIAWDDGGRRNEYLERALDQLAKERSAKFQELAEIGKKERELLWGR